MGEDKSLEDRAQERLDGIHESRRKRALEQLPPRLKAGILEASPVPIIVYERMPDAGHRITYANPSALDQLGYNFTQLMTFNNIMLDTGLKKEHLDDILQFCVDVGFDDLPPLQLTIPTLDRKELRIEPQMHYERVGNGGFWVGYVLSAKKVDPRSLGERTKNLLTSSYNKLFQGSREFIRAPEVIDDDFILSAIKNIATKNSNNMVIDLKHTKKVIPESLHNLRAFSLTYRSRLHLVNASPALYRTLEGAHVQEETLYRPNTFNFAAQPA